MRRYIAFRKQSGGTLVEVLVAIALTGIMLPALATALIAAHAGRSTTIQQLQANSLLREAQEAVRSVREKGWSNVTTNGTYHPVINAGSWTLVAGAETINGFSRQIVISTPQRNTTLSNWPPVASGGTNDPNTKHVVVTVSWTTPYANSVSSDTYLTRWQNNAVWSQTTQADFTGGTLTNTCATSTCDQASPPNNTVQLQDLPATWQLPSVIGTYNVANTAANDVFMATIGGINYAFVGYTGGLAIVNVNNPAAPTLASTFNPGGGVNGVYVVGTTAYLATTSNNAELVTVNVANPAAPAQLDTLNLGDTGDALCVFVSGNYAYVGKVAAGLLNQEFFVVNVTNPANITQSATLARQNANINYIFVSGNFAYIATSKTNAQFMVINVTSKTSVSISASVNLGVAGTEVKLSGTTAFVTTQNNTSAGELRVYNVTTPTAPAAVGSGYEVGGNATSINIDATNPNYAILGTAVASKQAIILNITTPSSITLVNNMNIGSTINDVFVSGAYAYLASASTTQGLTIVYTGYRPSGTFESSTFNAGANVGFNALYFTTTEPSGTSLQFQVAANNTGSGWTYIGPDGTSGTFFTAATGTSVNNVYSIPLSIASNQYFRYKAFFTPTSNGQQTPALSDVTVNYSP